MENSVVQTPITSQPQNVQVPNYSGVNIQIFNPSVAAPGATLPVSNVNAPTYSTAPSYPANYYTQNLAQPIPPIEETTKKKTETREIVELTDDYIKSVENYLNNQSKEIRMLGAKEVLARCQEDESRKDDPALNALVNKMLQDPYPPIQFIAMGILEGRLASGNAESVAHLQKIQQRQTAQGEDSLKASNTLLKMAATTAKKEFEVNETKKSKSNQEK